MTKNMAKIGTGYGGDEGRPGDQFARIIATIWRRNSGRYRCKVRSQSGSNQGDLEIHDDCEVIGRGDTLDEAADDAKQLAEEAEYDAKMLAEAMSQATDEAEDFSDEH